MMTESLSTFSGSTKVHWVCIKKITPLGNSMNIIGISEPYSGVAHKKMKTLHVDL
jgi:hypothetical protein